MTELHNAALLQQYIASAQLDTQIATIAEYRFRLYRFKKRDYLCRMRQPVTHMFFLVSGRVKISQTAPNGNSLLLCYFGAGDMIGDVELINDQPASSDVQAVTDIVDCLELDLTRDGARIMADPAFLLFLCRQLGQKLEYTSRSAVINLLSKLECRLAAYILQSAEDDIFLENLSETSAFLGTSYRHLMWTLRRFIDKGILERGSDGYHVLNRAALSDLCAHLY